MLARRPAHPILASIGFGCSVAAAMALPPGGRPDPLLLPAIAAGSTVAAGLLMYAVGWRVVAACTSTLALACLIMVGRRIQHGSWSGPPLALVPVVVLAMASWIPGRPRGPSSVAPRQDPTRTHVLAPTGSQHNPSQDPPPWWHPSPRRRRPGAPRVLPAQVTWRLNGRWAVFGNQPLPGADPGGHSQVYLAFDTWRGHHVVAKLPGGPDITQSTRRLMREATLLRALHPNPHLVRLLEAGHDRSSGTFYLILAYYPQGSLAGLLKSTASFELGWAIGLAQALLDGLASLHHRPGGAIAHRDLNPRNVLVGHNRRTPVLCDFSMARGVPADPTEDTITTGLVYSPWYSAPELVNGRAPWGLAVDSYGLGAILYELLTGLPPLRWESLSLRQDFATLTWAGIRPASAGLLNTTLPAPLVDLIDQCLAADPTERPANADLLQGLEHLRDVDHLPVPYAALRRENGPARFRSA